MYGQTTLRASDEIHGEDDLAKQEWRAPVLTVLGNATTLTAEGSGSIEDASGSS
jgi:hypothetical protein